MYAEEQFFNEMNHEYELELRELIFILTRRWKIIAKATVIIAILGIFFAFTRPNIYKSQSLFIVSSGDIFSVKNLDRKEISRNQMLLTTYTEIAKSKEVVERVAKRLDIEEDIDDLAKRIKVYPVVDTELMNISFTDKDARTAMIFTAEVSREFMAKVEDAMNFQNLKIVEDAKMAVKPESKMWSVVFTISIAFGVLVGVLLAFAMEFLHHEMKKPDDIEKILGFQIIGDIPDFKLAKKEMKRNGI